METVRASRPSVVLALVAVCAGVWAQTPTDYQVKAAYLSNFGRFVEWPARAAVPEDQAFHICVLGEDPFGPILDAALAGETIRRAPLAARRIARPEDAGSCRIVFVSSSLESQLKTVIAALAGTNALTVSDIPQFARRGGMIELVVVAKKVRFEINLAAVERAGLTVSSELLKLALTLRRPPR